MNVAFFGFAGEGLILEIHHGGELYRESDGNYAYRGGVVLRPENSRS